jgi:hypothetical protein
MTREEFIQYVLDFYSAASELYPWVAATRGEVLDATLRLEREYMANSGETPYLDSIDRERVRDFILANRG